MNLLSPKIGDLENLTDQAIMEQPQVFLDGMKNQEGIYGRTLSVYNILDRLSVRLLSEIIRMVLKFPQKGDIKDWIRLRWKSLAFRKLLAVTSRKHPMPITDTSRP